MRRSWKGFSAACAAVSLFLLGASRLAGAGPGAAPLPAAAQLGAQLCPCSVVFEVTLKGEGSGKQGSEDVSWKVDQKYSGNVELREGGPYVKTLAESGLSREEFAEARDAKVWTSWLLPQLPVDVTINDQIVRTYSFKDDAGRTDGKETTTWTGSGQVMGGLVSAGMSLKLDTLDDVYDFSFSTAPRPPNSQKIRVLTRREGQYALSGKAAEPFSQQDPEKMEGIETMPLPVIKGLMDQGNLSQSKVALKISGGAIEFDSGSQPQSPGSNVNVRVHYKISKLPK